VGRTARASATGDAYTFVSPDEEGDLRAIERHMGKPLPRHRLAAFDYTARPAERLEIPLQDRLRVMHGARRSGKPAARDGGPGRAARAGQGGVTRSGARMAGSPARRVSPGLAWLQEMRAERPSRPAGATSFRR
jgi:ATP-dependent RNA helicase RhlE